MRYPGPELQKLDDLKWLVEQNGLRVGVVEGYLPMESIKRGNDGRTRDLKAMKTLVREMGKRGIGVLCYHFMPTTDWLRTRFDVQERGGALVSEFNLREAEKAWSGPAFKTAGRAEKIAADTLWGNLEVFLKEIVPVAEDSGVYLAMHPDDPPIPSMQGMARIMSSVESFDRLVELVPSKHNGICFCQGCFAAMGVDIPATIRRLGKHIRYVHFRDVRGGPTHFVETFHDNGPTNMPEAMAAYHEIGFRGPVREDHVPQMVGEVQGEPGYTMLGRLFAYGYIRALIQAAAHFGKNTGTTKNKKESK